MIQDYLIAELSARLERLQSASAGFAADLARLRRRIETRSAAELPAETARALALADRLCWDSLSNGDTAAFDRQAAISADLRMFCICARLLPAPRRRVENRAAADPRLRIPRPAPDAGAAAARARRRTRRTGDRSEPRHDQAITQPP